MNKNYFKRCAVCVMAAAQLMLASCGGPAAEVSGKNLSSALQSGEVSAAESGYTTTSDAYLQGGSSMISSAGSSALSSGNSSKTSSLTSSATYSKTSSLTSSTATSSVYTPPADTREINGKTYNISFVEEFTGSSLNTKYWSICPNWTRGDSVVKAKWDSSTVEVKNGNLVINTWTGSDGTILCGGVRTINKYTQGKGYYECRCIVPKTSGCIGAFWLITNNMNNSAGNGAKDGIELDILESISRDKTANQAIHWDGYGTAHKQMGQAVSAPYIYDGNYHTFGCEWSDDAYTYFIDGKKTYTIRDVDCCNIEAYIKLTVEYGEWVGVPNTTNLRDSFVVDYVRVYQKA